MADVWEALLTSEDKTEEMVQKAIADNPDEFINSAFEIILSAAPTTLKAKCFTALSGLAHDDQRRLILWQLLDSSQILPKEFVDAGKGGIISDINVIEAEARSYPLLLSFISFLAYLTFDHAPEIDFTRFHQFAYEQGLLKLRHHLYSNPKEKWQILCSLCQTWSNLSSSSNCLYRTAFCDSRYIRELCALFLEEDTPSESLFCILRLLAQLCLNESTFADQIENIDRSSCVPVARQISWSSPTLTKLINCVSSNDADLQLTAIALIKVLCLTCPDIAQIIFSSAAAKAIPTLKKCLSVDEPETDLQTNVRVQILDLLTSLGSSSHFLRHVCGFDVTDPPKSLLRSTLESGILPKLLEKMRLTEAAKNYPTFAASSLRILFELSDHPYTSSPVLSLLRSSLHSFFDEQLTLLQDSSASLCAIGCFLQLLAREALDSCQKCSSGTTVHSFRTLLGANGFMHNRGRVSLMEEFLDRMDSGKEAEDVAKGVFEATLAFASNDFIRKELKDQKEGWSSPIYNFELHLLRAAGSITNEVSTRYLANSSSIVGQLMFTNSPLGPFDSDEVGREAIKTLTKLRGLGHYNSRIGIYSLLNILQVRCQIDERGFVSAIMEDIDHEVAMTKAAAHSAVEAMFPVISAESSEMIVLESIKMLDGDWALYDEDNSTGSFVMRAKFSLYERLLALHSEMAKILIDNQLIKHISYENFWNSIGEAFSTSAMLNVSSVKLQTAAKAVRLVTSLAIILSNDDEFRKQSAEFAISFKDSFNSVLDFGGLITVDALQFLNDLCCFVAMIPWTSSVFIDRVNQIRERICVSDKWRELLRSQNGEEIQLKEAEAIVEKLRVALDFIKSQKLESMNE